MVLQGWNYRMSELQAGEHTAALLFFPRSATVSSRRTLCLVALRLFVTACQKLKLVVGAGLLTHRCYAVVFAAVALGQLERLDELVAYRVAAACVSPPCSCLHSNECRSFHTGSELTIWDRVLSATLCYSYLCHSVPLYASTIQPHPGGRLGRV